jgi:hypothetical protein
MKNRRRILILLACAAALSTMLWLTRAREPYYKGKYLSEWLEVLGEQSVIHVTEESMEAEDAVWDMGTNIVPFLTTSLQYEQPAWKKHIHGAVGRLPSSLVPNWLAEDRALRRKFGAWYFILSPAKAFGARQRGVRGGLQLMNEIEKETNKAALEAKVLRLMTLVETGEEIVPGTDDEQSAPPGAGQTPPPPTGCQTRPRRIRRTGRWRQVVFTSSGVNLVPARLARPAP